MTDKVIQSYVWHEGKCFFVSTINRVSSALASYGAEYAETMAWECDQHTMETGKLLGQMEGCAGSTRAHMTMCQQLAELGHLLEDEE